MKRTKEQQFKIAQEVIKVQAEELVNKYGWDERIIKRACEELIQNAHEEIDEWGKWEDLSYAWSLIRWITDVRSTLVYNLRSLSEKEERHYRSIASA